jgi:hypothetical protein
MLSRIPACSTWLGIFSFSSHLCYCVNKSSISLCKKFFVGCEMPFKTQGTVAGQPEFESKAAIPRCHSV